MSRGLVDNVLSGMKAGFKSILNYEHPNGESRMFNLKSSSKLSATLLALILGASVFMTGQVWAAKMVKDPSTGKMVSAPKYGGTIKLVANIKNEGIDPYVTYTAGIWIGLVNEKLGLGDWAFDRSVYGYNTLYLPLEVLRGQLAESWENPDPLTYVFKIRSGVNWHKKAPVNGRALTAHDVAFNFNRILGLSGGKPGQDMGTGALIKLKWDSIKATNNSTVVFKLTEPSIEALKAILIELHTYIVAPEAVKKYGDIQDWRNVVGTGPYQLTDVVEGSSWTYTKIDDYWGFDEKFPDNRLPYADKIEYLIVTDPTTGLALMRSGQADMQGWGMNSHLTNVDQALNLQKTNPELVFSTFSFRSETSINWDNQSPPWNDIRVRRAIQMAIDFETIATSYHKGWSDPAPTGCFGKNLIGYALPFEEWPEEIAQYHRYDPEAAKKLLAEAGFPNGFKTFYEHYEYFDLGYYQVAMEYLKQNLNIEAEIKLVTRAEHQQNSKDINYLGIRTDVYGAEYDSILSPCSSNWSKNGWRPQNVKDYIVDMAYENALAATTIEGQKKWLNMVNLRVADQAWTVRGPRAPLFNVAQPWIKGYNGEGDLGAMQRGPVHARLWVDRE